MDANLDPSLHGLDLDEHLATNSNTGGQHESDIILGEYDPTQQGPDLQVHDGEGVGQSVCQRAENVVAGG